MAAKRTKGLSFEEKRKRLCELFYESVRRGRGADRHADCRPERPARRRRRGRGGVRPQKEFYNFKELEKLAPKQQGIGTVPARLRPASCACLRVGLRTHRPACRSARGRVARTAHSLTVGQGGPGQPAGRQHRGHGQGWHLCLLLGLP